MVEESEAMKLPANRAQRNNERDNNMTIRDRGSIYEVNMEACEVARFNASFPCSDIPVVDCLFQFEKKTGDLVDESEHLREVENSSAISALCEDARVYAENTLGRWE